MSEKPRKPEDADLVTLAEAVRQAREAGDIELAGALEAVFVDAWVDKSAGPKPKPSLRLVRGGAS